MTQSNTKIQPQTGRNYPANGEWVLRDKGGNVIKSAEPEVVEYEPIINAEGQTQKEWRRDLSRREREELFGGLAEFATNGVGYILFGVVQIVVAIVKLPVLLAVKLSEHEEQSFRQPRQQHVREKPTVNVNVEVNGHADVNVNVKVNQ